MGSSAVKIIKIRLQRPTDIGRLFYTPDPDFESYGVFIQNRFRGKQVHFINISGEIVLDLNQDFVIQSVEFIIAKKFWKQDKEFLIPEPTQNANLQVVNLSKKGALFEIPIKSLTDENNSWVFFYWGESFLSGEWVMLSYQVFGLIQENYLMGFFIKLTEVAPS